MNHGNYCVGLVWFSLLTGTVSIGFTPWHLGIE